MLIVLCVAAALAGGVVARLLRLPGGMIVGAMVGAAAASLWVGGIELPEAFRTVVLTAVGVMIGSQVTREMLRALRPALLPAVASGALLILAGLLIALLLRALGMAPEGDVLATSPGALSVLAGAAAEQNAGAPTVALFHVTRIVLILLTLPLVLRLLPPAPARTGGPTDDPDAFAPQLGGRTGDRRSEAVRLGAIAVGAIAGGQLALLADLDGALIFGTTVGAAIVTATFRSTAQTPKLVRTAAQVGLGCMIGTLITPDTLVALGQATGPAVLAAVLMLLAGVGVAFLLRAIGHAPPGDVLATSPGALEAVSAAAIDRGDGVVQVALFHTVRLLLVIGSLPLLLQLLP
ncbi:hypothetical protein ER308_13640 [Egibacter rhizosphaerae]|uniref:AbrB family transcriptional regulator n=1 Tax=Egibacter rhizosphaerae TaxID=1670831 RepID=A0A411YH03_9ACTN|nr:AbrB family transcriptional regulator [Egibacter rhizosphaerae]QBI20503.1 hypothetical protein ER308_13640 [Egibacter rhizosphaerae]